MERIKSTKVQNPIKLAPNIPEENISNKNPAKIAKTSPVIFLGLSKILKIKTAIKTKFKIYPRKSKKTAKVFWTTVKK